MNDQEIEFFIKSDLPGIKQPKNLVLQIIFLIFYGIMHLMINLNIFKSSNFKDFKKTKISQTDKDALSVMDLNDDVNGKKYTQI